MYIITFRVEYLHDIMGELAHDFCAPDVICDALNIFLSMFDINGKFQAELRDEESIAWYCRQAQAAMEDIPIEHIDGNYSEVTEMLVNCFLDNICGFFDRPPLHPMNLENLYALIGLYYDHDEVVSVIEHRYNPITDLLKLYVM